MDRGVVFGSLRLAVAFIGGVGGLGPLGLADSSLGPAVAFMGRGEVLGSPGAVTGLASLYCVGCCVAKSSLVKDLVDALVIGGCMT